MSINFEIFSQESHKTLDSVLDICLNTQKQKYAPSDLLQFESISIPQVDDLTPQTHKSIRCMLIGINQKLKVYDHLCSSLHKANLKIIEEQSKSEKNREEFRNTCRKLLEQREKMQNEISRMSGQIKDLNLKILNQEMQGKCFEDFKTLKELEILSLQQQIENLRKGYQSSSSPFLPLSSDPLSPSPSPIPQSPHNQPNLNEALNSYLETIDSLTKENESLRQTIIKQSQSHDHLIADFNELRQEVITLTSSIIGFESQTSYQEELEAQIKKLEEDLKKSRIDFDNLQTQFKQIGFNYETTFKELYQEKFDLIQHNKRVSKELSDLHEKFINLQNDYLELQSKNYNNSHVNTLSFTLLTNQNLKLLQDSKDFCEFANKLEDKLIKENNYMSSNYIEISENYLILQRLLSRILIYIRDRELENSLLRESVDRLQRQKIVYVPLRNDYIDVQLACFINSSPVPIEVPFIRISPGIYLFGTKRVVLKAENMEISIRVGGGFVKLEDFINNQTHFEIGKLKERELKAHRSIPSSPIYGSPEPQNIDRIGSPKFMNSPKLPIPRSPKGLIEKKKTPASSGKVNRKNTAL